MHTIRPEQPADVNAISSLVRGAFPTAAEANLVVALRHSNRLLVSLVAVADDQIVGHVGLSPVMVNGKDGGVGLAPLAVAANFRRQGIGAALVREGLNAARAAGYGFAVVLGEPDYYGRFGFVPASRSGLSDEYGGGEAFQIIEFIPGAIPSGGGVVKYSPEFSAFGGGGS